MQRRVISPSLILTTLLLAAGLTACGKTETSASLMADAKQYQQKGDNKAALIQLKNAAAKSPEDVEVRFQLAELYNATGDIVSAEKEIRKAISLGGDAARAAPILAKALLLQGQPQKALDAAATAKAGAEVWTLRGDAYLMLHDTAKAKDAYDQALATQPGNPDALLGLSRLAMADKDIEGAKRLLDQAVAANPKNASVWFFKGSMLRFEKKPDEAIAAFGQAIAAKPDNVNAYLERATLETAVGKFEAAKADIDAARKLAPTAPSVFYTQAMFDFTQGKYPAAQESLQKVLRVAPEHLPSILLAAAVELRTGALQQAEAHARKYLSAVPNNPYATKLLAEIQLRSAQPGDAAATLAPLLKQGTDDAQVLAMAGQSAMSARDFNKASEYFGKASALSPNMAVLHSSLGLSKMGQGDQAAGVSELERATAIDPKSEQAGAALVSAEMSLKHYDKALAAAQALIKAQPENAVARNLEGSVHVTKGDRAAARASFEKSASLAPTYFAPVMNLARLDMEDKKPDAAKQRLLAFLEKDKKNIGAMEALAAIANAQQHPEEVTSWLEKASAENPDAIAPARQLTAHYLRTNQPAKALVLARKQAVAHPTDPDLLDLLGQSQAANRDLPGALDSYGKLVGMMPKSAQAQLRLASVHIKMNNQTAAADDLKKALALNPDFIPARMAQMQLAMLQGHGEQALALARQMPKKTPAQAVTAALVEGDVLIALKKPDQAARSYDQAFSLSKSPQMLIKVASALKAAGKDKEAQARLAQWQKEHPDDRMIGLFAAQESLAAKQYKQAIPQFEALSKQAPDDFSLLNNLAWAYQQEKDPRALPTAERAAKLSGDNPAVLDTLGYILVEQGNTTRALPLLEKAVAAAPTNPDIRYHLALGLNKSGDKASARKQLEKALAGGGNFAQADEARALLKQL